MKTHTLPPQDVLLALLRYEPETGKLYWRRRSTSFFTPGERTVEHQAAVWNANYAGTEAFTAINEAGYRRGRLLGKSCRAHRVIFKMMTGRDPDEVDHIDGDRQNNSWRNLREVDRQQNCRNTGLSRRNKSGAPGVHWYSDNGGCWRAYLYLGGKTKYIGTFATKDDAVRARREAERKLGYHSNHGRRIGWERAQDIQQRTGQAA